MNQDKYRSPVVLSFTHVYFSTDKRQAQTVSDAQEALAKLQAESELTQSFKGMGDAFMLQKYYPDKTQQEILRLFGDEFSQKTFQIPVGKWTGPIESAYGLHLVYVHGRVESTMPDLADIQDRVLQDWAGDKRREINEKFYASLLSRYEVIVEQKKSDEKTLVSEKLQ
jgi:parvulin-like peptidyl-prolyl isomerase